MINTNYLDKLCREYNELDEKINKLSFYFKENVNIINNKYYWKGAADGHFCSTSLLLEQLKSMQSYRTSLYERINSYLMIREQERDDV